MGLSKTDLEDLKYAKMLLENPSLAAKMMNSLGNPLEKGFQYLPEKWFGRVQQVTEKALKVALHFALVTMDDKLQKPSSNTTHKILVGASGAVGGAFGLSALALELPVSTTIIIRSIADIARSEGENIQSIETKLACFEVFAFGGKSQYDDGAETGYFAIRAALNKAVSDAVKFISKRGITEQGSPILVRLIASIASRFGIVVSEKAAATAIPIVGAAGGAIINTIFIDHFQDMARGHFIVRRLERGYGKEMVKAEYDRLFI